MIYTGIGSRETPTSVLVIMELAAQFLARNSWTLRSGGAEGADTAFERGCDNINPKLKEIYLPWSTFNGRSSKYDEPTRAMISMARRYHRGWDRCSPAARKCLARNCGQVLGPTLNEPTRIIVCWTHAGRLVGGTSLALRIALDHDIPIINLGDPKCRKMKARQIVNRVMQT